MNIPIDCFEFLSNEDWLRFFYEGDCDFEVKRVELVQASYLQEVNVPLRSRYYRDQIGCKDAPSDKNWEYKAVPLVLRDFDEMFAPHSLLLWFPDLSRYGSWDNTHHIIFIFPNVSWAGIIAELFEYINSPWDLSSSLHQPFMPWRGGT